MSDRDRSDPPRKSWRDLDNLRDKSRGGGAPQRAEPTSERNSRQHRAALEALFAQGGMGRVVEAMSPLPPAASPSIEHRVTASGAQRMVASGSALVATVAPSSEPVPQETSEASGGSPSTKPKAAKPDHGSKPALRKSLLAAIGRDEVTRAADRYLKHFGLPEDFEVLTQVLDHRQEQRVLEALAALERLLEKQKPQRKLLLNGKLRYLIETSFDAQMKEAAERVRAKLG